MVISWCGQPLHGPIGHPLPACERIIWISCGEKPAPTWCVFGGVAGAASAGAGPAAAAIGAGFESERVKLVGALTPLPGEWSELDVLG